MTDGNVQNPAWTITTPDRQEAERIALEAKVAADLLHASLNGAMGNVSDKRLLSLAAAARILMDKAYRAIEEIAGGQDGASTTVR